MDLITSGRRWEGEEGTLNEGIERGRRRGEGVEEERKIAEEKEEKRKEGQGVEVGDGGGEGTLHLLHCIILQISEVSDIPVERVEFAKVCGKRCAHLCSPRGLPVWLPLMFPELRIISK